MSRGDVWLHRFGKPDKRRPVLVLSRQDALQVLRSAIVAPITSTIRDLPSEVLIGVEDGMKAPCAVNLDNVQTVKQETLTRYVTTLGPDLMKRVCRALGVATGCS